MSVQQLMLHDDHGIGITQSSLDETLGVLSGAGSHNLQAGEMADHAFQRLGVLAGVTTAGTHGHTQHQRDRTLTAGHILQLGSLVEQGVGALGHKVVVH